MCSKVKETRFLETLSDCAIEQLVTEPTREASPSNAQDLVRDVNLIPLGTLTIMP